MDLNEINTALIEKDLPRLERHFFLRYKGQVPDYDNYNETVERMMKIITISSKGYVYSESTGKYSKPKNTSIGTMKLKVMLIDAILTVRHYNRLDKEKSKKDDSVFSFDIYQQLMEVA